MHLLQIIGSIRGQENNPLIPRELELELQGVSKRARSGSLSNAEEPYERVAQRRELVEDDWRASSSSSFNWQDSSDWNKHGSWSEDWWNEDAWKVDTAAKNESSNMSSSGRDLPIYFAGQTLPLYCGKVLDREGLIDGITALEFVKRFHRVMTDRLYHCYVCRKPFKYQGTRTAPFYGDFVNKKWSSMQELVEMFNNGQTDARWICVPCKAKQLGTDKLFKVATDMRCSPASAEALRRMADNEIRQEKYGFEVPRGRK